MRHNYRTIQPLVEQRLRDIIASEGPREPRYGYTYLEILSGAAPNDPLVSKEGRFVDDLGLVWAWQSSRQVREWLQANGVEVSDAVVGRCLKGLIEQGGWVRIQPGIPMDQAYAYRPLKQS